jgi:hypothetical protein
MNDEKYLGKIAYDAYAFQSAGRSLISGVKLPEWDGLKEEIKLAWHAAASAIMQECERRLGG